MLLKKVAYSEFSGSSREWELEEIELQNINLIVGKNAAGKSRTLNVIYGLANIIFNSPKIAYKDGHFEASFIDSNNKIFQLEIKFKEGIISDESLIIDDVKHISRRENGEGNILNNKNELVAFKIPNDELIIGRRDELQFPYLENIHKWASVVRHFRFTLERQKNTLAIIDSNEKGPKEFNFRETDKVLSIFNKGQKKYGDKFIARLIDDFKLIGYEIENIELSDLISITLDVSTPGTVIKGLVVKEKDRVGKTDQNAMSDGMFRAISILIHFAYYDLEGLEGCILIDDIGEGLDFERASSLIKLLIAKAEASKVQLIMSTNDKFVMNNTDLKYWQIIHRVAGKVHLYNQINSPQIFEDFKYSGLNNFDFFTTDFYKSGFTPETFN